MNAKSIICVKKKSIWNPATRSCKNDKYSANIIGVSLIKCEETIEETKTDPTNFNEKKFNL